MASIFYYSTVDMGHKRVHPAHRWQIRVVQNEWLNHTHLSFFWLVGEAEEEAKASQHNSHQVEGGKNPLRLSCQPFRATDDHQDNKAADEGEDGEGSVDCFYASDILWAKDNRLLIEVVQGIFSVVHFSDSFFQICFKIIKYLEGE